MTDARFEEWLARWREASSQCWARPGVCCRSCRVEALGGPGRPEIDSPAADAGPAPVTPTDRTKPLSARPGRGNGHESTDRRAAA